MLGLRTPVPLLAITILLVVPVEATTSYYQGPAGETSFNSAVGGLTLLNPLLTFSSGDLASGGLFNANGTGINFLGFDDFFFNTPKDLTVASGKLTATQQAEVVTITFPAAGVYAFGIHLTVTSGTGFWCVDLTHGVCNYQITNTSPANAQFFGFVSNTPVTAPLYIRAQSGSPTMVITDFEAYTVPEPGTMLLVGLGLVILPLTRRKIRPRL
ncbi:MAG: hypothetical protein JWO19_1137 [Bryobacterales bacterium]|nr:hypothetical protein [Bryobacterales bacterium]